MRVIRSTGKINDKNHNQLTDTQILERAWDYWERQGYSHPSKRECFGVKPLKPIARKGV